MKYACVLYNICMVNTTRTILEVLWSRLIGILLFIILFFGSTTVTISLICAGSKPSDACGDIGLVVAPVTVIFSVIVVNFFMKRRAASLQSKGIVMAEPGKPITIKEIIIVGLLMVLFVWGVIHFFVV